MPYETEPSGSGWVRRIRAGRPLPSTAGTSRHSAIAV